MRTARLEAFSDGVLAIIITIMVLELSTPPPEDGFGIGAFLRVTGPGLLTYLLSFVYVGIYWNNHHHMFSLVRHISGAVLWANLGLLFFLSLFPFTTRWMDDSRLLPVPVAVYGTNLLLAAIAYYVLQTVIIRQQGPGSPLAHAVGVDLKGKLSPVLYLVGIVCASVVDTHGRVGVALALAAFTAVALMWVVPDRRIARVIDRA
ncbi:MAG TPA: TMEM175 family protein [Micromonosporaceae bacterium]